MLLPVVGVLAMAACAPSMRINAVSCNDPDIALALHSGTVIYQPTVINDDSGLVPGDLIARVREKLKTELPNQINTRYPGPRDAANGTVTLLPVATIPSVFDQNVQFALTLEVQPANKRCAVVTTDTVSSIRSGGEAQAYKDFFALLDQLPK